MANLGFIARVRYTSIVGTMDGTARTALQIVPQLNQRCLIRAIKIGFTGGTDDTDTPRLVELVRQTSAGTFQFVAAPSFVNNADAPNTFPIPNTQIFAAAYGTEPTDSGDVPFAELVHWRKGLHWQAKLGREFVIYGGERLGVRLTIPSGLFPAVTVWCEE